METTDNREIIEVLNRIRELLEPEVPWGWSPRQPPHVELLSLLTGAHTRAEDPKRLNRAYAQVYSQYGEDGYIAEIFARIGCGNRTFLEIGIGDGRENTTRFLLEQGWRGVWVEGSSESAAAARDTFTKFIDNGALTVVEQMIDRDNINEAIALGGMGDGFDLITIDIDRHTSHAWRALTAKGRVCCIEYNASIPPSVAVEVDYEPAIGWDYSNYFGAGLKIMEQIGRAKAMNLVGCDLTGLNAYFVAESECGNLFQAPFTAENHYELPKYRVLMPNLGFAPSPAARTWRKG